MDIYISEIKYKYEKIGKNIFNKDTIVKYFMYDNHGNFLLEGEKIFKTDTTLWSKYVFNNVLKEDYTNLIDTKRNVNNIQDIIRKLP